MSVAGRVAIKPSGDYNVLTPYERLDLVSYDGGLYLAKKASTGITPTAGSDTEYWMYCGISSTPTMSPSRNGIGRPDGETITVGTNGVFSAVFPEIKNNLETEESGSVLDARQGKILKDKLDSGGFVLAVNPSSEYKQKTGAIWIE